jgi:hypothetical protein
MGGRNDNYKDTVFSSLFNDRDVLRELYGALGKVILPPDIPVTINTLSDVLYMGRKNDVSFMIGGKLVVVVEHQSTINPNMPFRLFMYINRILEAIAGNNKRLYSNKPISLPYPEFYVLYNGTAPFDDEKTLKLSDLFEKVGSLGLPEKPKPSLELEVQVFNINNGHNENIVKQCGVLSEYSAFIATVRKFEKEETDKETAFKKAIQYCRNNGILVEYLRKNSVEVINMLTEEWNLEDALEVRFTEGREEGRKDGRLEGIETAAKNALKAGATVEFVQQITGLNPQTIQQLSVSP